MLLGMTARQSNPPCNATCNLLQQLSRADRNLCCRSNQKMSGPRDMCTSSCITGK